MKRLHPEDLTQKFPTETVAFVPTFQFLWQEIAPNLTAIGLETKVQNRLRKSIGDLPTVLQPLWNDPANINTIAQARILFFGYARQNSVARYLSESVHLRERFGLTKLQLRSHITTWFTEQSLVHRDIAEDPSSLETELKQLPEAIQAGIKSGEMTIAQLLVVAPGLFYKLPGML